MEVAGCWHAGCMHDDGPRRVSTGTGKTKTLQHAYQIQAVGGAGMFVLPVTSIVRLHVLCACAIYDVTLTLGEKFERRDLVLSSRFAALAQPSEQHQDVNPLSNKQRASGCPQGLMLVQEG